MNHREVGKKGNRFRSNVAYLRRPEAQGRIKDGSFSPVNRGR